MSAFGETFTLLTKLYWCIFKYFENYISRNDLNRTRKFS